MEAVAAAPGGPVPPFHDHDVREWSTIDSLTGALERARLETDHWTANTTTSRHKYGKVVDSRARTDADGALHQQARRQLEVFQSQVPGGHLQVIKTHTVSSSRWTNKSHHQDSPNFENLKLALNTLDLSSEKAKANVGRSVSRRPPSRVRPKDDLGSLVRAKSTSSEDFSKSTEDLEDLEELENWRRSSKLRRSLQFPRKPEPPKHLDLPESSGNVRKITEELEKGRRLSAALRGNTVDLDALDQILQTISGAASTVEASKKEKRSSFVTVESLQEVRGRLRRTSSPEAFKQEEEIDDGIVTDPTHDVPVKDTTRVRSYVFGMEAKNPISGTGSLESRTKLQVNLKNEDWYTRRKSYGFEQMHNHQDAVVPLRNKNRVESSTDSGICRSSDLVTVPPDDKMTSVKQISSIFDQSRSTTIKIPILAQDVVKRHSIAALEDSTQRRSKKVEFCKTEVHFAADSGKVNIVETDEKPPPTNNFRRRRRNSGPVLGDGGLPVLHFGDTSYEKELLGGTEEDESNGYPPQVSTGTVTVNSSSNHLEPLEDDRMKDNVESVRGILKNKPIKPTPYHLGDDHEKWGVRLKPVQKPETPFWKSTVTLHNTYEQPEFQKLLRNLRPTTGNKPDLLSTSDNISSVKFVTSTSNNQAWSVADRVQLSEGTQWAENKYSTKVNFGDGGAAVVEDTKDSEKILNKGLVVRIGRNDSKHTVCAKTTASDMKTTTKITIDLSPSPTKPRLSTTVPQQQQQRRSHSFKSTSLILDCLKSKNANIPQQLEALKRLYDDVHSDSDADKEVQVLMERMERGEEETSKEDDNTELSGSWSKMKACRILNRDLGAKIEKDETKSRSYASEESPRYKIKLRDKYSPVITRKTSSLAKKSELSTLSNPLQLPTTFANITDEKLHQKHASNDIVLRQPKLSEMTYFGVKSSKSVITKESTISEKPDLLQHMNEPPIYENVTREFDSKILEELTKAADEILKAVNNFTDDEEEDPVKEPLATISETKSWSQGKATRVVPNASKLKLKATSSTSSVESLSKTRKSVHKVAPVKKKIASNDSGSSRSAATKARRLQRASSREALLQSRGSSSEDLGAQLEPPQRKPRQVKKTKTTQITLSNGLEAVKKATAPSPSKRKDLPEIRHKTAVSTIRSTQEKSSRIESTKKAPSKKETNKGFSSKVDRKGAPTRNISDHRISTANIKKCHRAEEATKR